MKKTLNWITMIVILAFVFSCSSSDESSISNDSGSDKTETSFNFTMSSFLKQETADSSERQAAFSADQIMTGQLTATNTDDSSVQTFDWSIYLDEETFDVQSNKTIILAPGTYDFSLLLTKGDQQYAGTTLGQVISDGTFDVPMTIRPVIGETVTDVSVVATLADFKFQYDPAELSSLTTPQMGIIVDSGTEVIYAINPTTGISDNYINLTAGSHSLQLKLYDGSLQVGRSISVQETVVVSVGTNITMDLVALHGETTFALAEDGGDATFSFNIPADVVNEAGGADNLEVLFSIVGDNNPIEENLLTLVDDGSGGYESSITLTGKQFDDITISLTFTEISSSEQLGSCAMSTTLDTTERTLNCDITLRRRAIIGGSLLATLGVNVFNEAGEPVAGAVVSENGNILGITGSGAFGTEGYLKTFLNAGNYQVRAETTQKYNELLVSLYALDIENLSITISFDLFQNYNMPDSGQTSCFDSTGTSITCPSDGQAYAQDGSYWTNPLSYTDNGDGTVEDNVTGLTWQKEDDGITRNWADADSYCRNLILADKYDWRLPNELELMSIVNYENTYPSIHPVFTATKSNDYWTKTHATAFPDDAWMVDFVAGHFNYSNRTNSFPSRCVSGSEIVSRDFQDNGNGTVSDNSTGLMWQTAESSSMTWADAISYCEGLLLAGYTDWRLPNYKELLSLVDYTKEHTTGIPDIDTTFFPGTRIDAYWTATTYLVVANYAFYVNFNAGNSNTINKNDLYFPRCVR